MIKLKSLIKEEEVKSFRALYKLSKKDYKSITVGPNNFIAIEISLSSINDTEVNDMIKDLEE